jgi:uncharacterized membrane protein
MRMTTKTIRSLTAAIAVILAIVVAWSMIAGNFFVPIIAIVLAIGLSYLLKRRTKEITKDERTMLLYEKAAGATIRFCIPLVTIIGIILFVLREQLSPEMATASYVLAYVACGFLIANSAFYSYYSRKH